MKATQLYRKHNGENSVTGEVNARVSAAERTQLHRAFCLATEQSGHRPKPRRLCCLGCSAARCVHSSDRGFGGSQRQSAYLLGQSRSKTDQQISQ